MKFQTIKDTLVETIPDGMKITDVINAKIKSTDLEVCFVSLFSTHLSSDKTSIVAAWRPSVFPKHRNSGISYGHFPSLRSKVLVSDHREYFCEVKVRESE